MYNSFRTLILRTYTSMDTIVIMKNKNSYKIHFYWDKSFECSSNYSRLKRNENVI